MQQVLQEDKLLFKLEKKRRNQLRDVLCNIKRRVLKLRRTEDAECHRYIIAKDFELYCCPSPKSLPRQSNERNEKGVVSEYKTE